MAMAPTYAVFDLLQSSSWSRDQLMLLITTCLLPLALVMIVFLRSGKTMGKEIPYVQGGLPFFGQVDFANPTYDTL